MHTTTIAIVVVLLYSTLSSTFTFMVYDVEVQVKNKTHRISWFDATNSTFRTTEKEIFSEYYMCNPRKASLKREKLAILLLGGTNFIISSIVLLIVTIAMGLALVKFGKTRERLTMRKRDGKEKALQNRKPYQMSSGKVKLNRESQMAVTLLLISSLHIIIHFVYMVDFVLMYSGIAIFNFSKSTIDTLEIIEEVTDALNILIRLWNFYVYITTIPSFRFAILELITCGRCPKSSGAT